MQCINETLKKMTRRMKKLKVGKNMLMDGRWIYSIRLWIAILNLHLVFGSVSTRTPKLLSMKSTQPVAATNLYHISYYHTLHTSWQLSPCENWKFEPAPSGNHTHPWGELWTFVLFDRDLCRLDIKRREDTVRCTRGSVVRPKEDLTPWLSGSRIYSGSSLIPRRALQNDNKKTKHCLVLHKRLSNGGYLLSSWLLYGPHHTNSTHLPLMKFLPTMQNNWFCSKTPRMNFVNWICFRSPKKNGSINY